MLIPGSDIIRPNSWFKIESSEYRPHNILNVGTLGLWDKLCDLFGGISIEQMQSAMKKINDRNLIKHSGEGITILEKCSFKS